MKAFLLVLLNLTTAQIDASHEVSFLPGEMHGLQQVILAEHVIDSMAKCQRLMRTVKMPIGYDLHCVKAAEWK